MTTFSKPVWIASTIPGNDPKLVRTSWVPSLSRISTAFSLWWPTRYMTVLRPWHLIVLSVDFRCVTTILGRYSIIIDEFWWNFEKLPRALDTCVWMSIWPVWDDVREHMACKQSLRDIWSWSPVAKLAIKQDALTRTCRFFGPLVRASTKHRPAEKSSWKQN